VVGVSVSVSVRSPSRPASSSGEGCDPGTGQIDEAPVAEHVVAVVAVQAVDELAVEIQRREDIGVDRFGWGPVAGVGRELDGAVGAVQGDGAVGGQRQHPPAFVDLMVVAVADRDQVGPGQ
jgi:hypothetical protein